jgi:phosphopantothenoylcysteine decarboxylase/phosphopantothenate--cysteine ligase
MLRGKKIVLGITGSIAAYKACLIIRLLKKKGAEVQVVITPSGKEFITPITLSALSENPVISEFFAQKDGTWHSHVSLGLWADAFLVAPCTASTLAKMANGVADNMLITTYLSMKAPTFIAPAMDLDMFIHPTTTANINKLKSFGNTIIEPASGYLASGLDGKGRMEEPENIVQTLENYFIKAEQTTHCNSKLKGKRVIITAGPTHERIDPVRFLGNYSSGKMGFALAEECLKRGADVHLVAGPVSLNCSDAIHRVNVSSAKEMYEASTSLFKHSDIAILCAAVADYRVATVAEKKLKRTAETLSLTLEPTEDIAEALGKQKTKDQCLVGFALETNDEEANAKLKLAKKNLDFIVLNSLQNADTCFQSANNKVSIINHQGVKHFDKKPKNLVAIDIINELENYL